MSLYDVTHITTHEFMGDHLIIEWEVGQGELLIQKLWLDGIPVKYAGLWDAIVPEAEKVIQKEYVKMYADYIEGESHE